jgi:hypothetical protein
MDVERVNSRIHVCARLRPLIAEDYKLGNVVRSAPERCVHLSKDGQTIKLTKDAFDAKLYRVDHTFDEAASQLDVYNLSLKKIVVEAINGYNGTGIVYGQTGSGKSHTIFGSEKEPGLVQLAISDVFEEVRTRFSKELVANVLVSFYQLYLEQAYDLLSTVASVSPKQLECVALGVREDAVKGTFVENLQYMYVDDEASTMEVVRMGLRNRRVHSTTYNMNSSRSHAIFQMYLDFEERDEASAQSQKAGNNSEARKLDIRRRVLTFVDLAGSERVQTHHQAKSKAQFKEAVAINKSISALGNCIQALASMSQQQQEGSVEGGGNAFLSASSGSNKISHVPFRDCKLTRLLAEPLGGNSKTCIIVNIGPCAYNLEETSSTLKFARRWVLSLVFTPVLLASFWFVCRAMTIRKRVKKGEIEQLQVQDVLSEATSPVRAPSPPRISLGGKKVTSMKVARVVVRDSPEERQQGRHRYADSEQDVTPSVDFGDGQPGEKEEYAGTLSRSNSGYFLHLPAGSAFDRYGSQHEGAELGGPAPQSVRLNLGDFLRACQTGGLGAKLPDPGTAGGGSEVPPSLLSALVGAVGPQSPMKPVQQSFPTLPTATSIALHMPSYVSEEFMQDVPEQTAETGPLTLDITFSPIAATSQSYSESPFTAGSSSAPGPVSLSWPASLLSPAATSSARTPSTSFPSSRPTTATTETLAQEPCDAASSAPRTPFGAHNIHLPSPHPNLDNVPRLSHEDSNNASSVASPVTPWQPSLVAGPVPMSLDSERSTAASNGAAEPAADEEALTQKERRRFVWERGSGDVNHTVDLTPIVSRYRGKGSDVAAVASVPTRSPHKQSDPGDDNLKPPLRDPPRSTSPSKLAGKKVTGFMKYAPAAGSDSAELETDGPDPTLGYSPSAGSSPVRDRQPSKSPARPVNGRPPLSAKKPSLVVVTSLAVRDETNSMPRSTPPKPSATPSPPPLHVPSKHPSVGSTGPYNFHRRHPAPSISKALVTPKKKSVNWGDKKSAPSSETKFSEATSPALAATLHPFERKGYSSPNAQRAITPEEVAIKLAALGVEGGERGGGSVGSAEEKEVEGTPQTALVKLVQELRDEVRAIPVL